MSNSGYQCGEYIYDIAKDPNPAPHFGSDAKTNVSRERTFRELYCSYAMHLGDTIMELEADEPLALVYACDALNDVKKTNPSSTPIIAHGGLRQVKETMSRNQLVGAEDEYRSLIIRRDPEGALFMNIMVGEINGQPVSEMSNEIRDSWLREIDEAEVIAGHVWEKAPISSILKNKAPMRLSM